MTDQPLDTPAVDEAAAADHVSVGTDVPGRDGGPQDAEAMRDAEGLSASSEVSEAYEEMLERGAAQEGEGRLP